MTTSRKAWKQHWKQANKSATFGTLLGLYTIAELEDLLAAKDVEVNVLTNDSKFVNTTWAESDPIAASNWNTDFNALLASYASAKQVARNAIANASSLLSPTMNTADAQYKGVLYSLNNQWENHTDGPGSLGDLRARLTAAGAPMTPYTVPQPRAGTDADLNAYRSADTAAKAIDSAGKGTMSLVVPILIGVGTLAGLYFVSNIASTVRTFK